MIPAPLCYFASHETDTKVYLSQAFCASYILPPDSFDDSDISKSDDEFDDDNNSNNDDDDYDDDDACIKT